MMRVVKDFQLASQNWLSMHVLVVHLPSASSSATVSRLDFGCSRMRGAVPGGSYSTVCTKKMANAHSLCHLTYLTIGLGVEDDGRGMFAGATRTVGLLFL